VSTPLEVEPGAGGAPNEHELVGSGPVIEGRSLGGLAAGLAATIRSDFSSVKVSKRSTTTPVCMFFTISP